MCPGSRRLPNAIISFAVLALCSPVEVAFAQEFSYAPYANRPPEIFDPGKQTTIWAGIASKPPQTEALQLEQLREATQLRETVTNRLRYVARYAESKDFLPAMAELEKVVREFKCDPKMAPPDLAKLVHEVRLPLSRVYPLLVPEAQSQASSWPSFAFFPPVKSCADLTQALAILSLEDVKAVDKPIRDRFTKEQADLQALLDAVQKATNAIQDKLNTPSSQQQLTNYLWALILIIGLLSLASVMSVRYFSEEIQKEWVNSGQVIQFVTVMLLLSVILVLGLAGILKEETLGTLLGGVGGYVLSQGVGRAVAQAVARQPK